MYAETFVLITNTSLVLYCFDVISECCESLVGGGGVKEKVVTTSDLIVLTNFVVFKCEGKQS